MLACYHRCHVACSYASALSPRHDAFAHGGGEDLAILGVPNGTSLPKVNAATIRRYYRYRLKE
jgi:hypothetical protein